MAIKENQHLQGSLFEEDYLIRTFHNSKSISIEEFQKKYLSDADEKDM